MKVLYFHQHFSTPSGATGTRSYEMAQRLIIRGHSVLMVCGSFQGGESGLESDFKKGSRRGIVNGLEVLEFQLPYSNIDSFLKRTGVFLRFALSSIRVVLSEKYDLVFATTTPLTAGIPGIVARWFRSKPFVFEVRDLWPELPKAMGVIRNPVLLKLMSILEWVSYHSASRCVGLSPGIVEGIKKCGIKEELVTMISNGCDLDFFSNAQPSAIKGVKKSDFVAIFTGTHGLANGVNAALDAALELKNRNRQDIKLCFIGSGRLKPDLIDQAKRDELDNCIFLDPIPKAELAACLKRADLGMQLLKNIPSFYYGTSPNKFFDYLATGLPVLNNYPGWLADLIKDNQCGFAIPPDSPSAFADALEAAVDDRVSLKEMGQHSVELAGRMFDRNKLADQFVNWLEGAAGC
jgi:glycosyltransferase involved in cell wall biosynthesis